MHLNTGEGSMSDNSNEHFDGTRSVPGTIHPHTILLWFQCFLFWGRGCRKDAQHFM